MFEDENDLFMNTPSVLLWTFNSSSVLSRPRIEPEIHLYDASYHGDQDESKSHMIQHGCHVLPLWFVDVQHRQHNSRSTGYNLSPSKITPYGNKC